MMDANVQGDNGECPVTKKLSTEQITVQSMGFFLAGYETTANTLSYTAYLLALHPQVQEKLQREIDSYMEDNPVHQFSPCMHAASVVYPNLSCVCVCV